MNFEPLEDLYPYNETYQWNYYLLNAFYMILKNKQWAIPIVHGFINGINMDTCAGRLSMILIARRSRHFAGTRYLKRGLNEKGKVANHVETE